MQEIDVAVVGAGQAGISLSAALSRRGIDHRVFERERPFASWRGRWDGFTANTPNWMNELATPGTRVALSGDPDGFATREELVAYFDACLAAIHPPLEVQSEVNRAERLADGRWLVEAAGAEYRASALAVCTGAMSMPRLPPGASDLPADVPQLHSSQYRNPAGISTSRVLIVGAASSGVQIARLLCESGRFSGVHMATSKVLVLPKRVLGIPVHRAIHRLGLFDVRTTSVVGRLMYSGLETRGDPITRPTPADLKRMYGLELHGRFRGFESRTILFEDDSRLSCDDLTVIWCTGFRPDYSFVAVKDRDAVFHPTGHPRHLRGVSSGLPGLYFVGLRYQHTVASHDIYGVARDAEFVADHIAAHNASRLKST